MAEVVVGRAALELVPQFVRDLNKRISDKLVPAGATAGEGMAREVERKGKDAGRRFTTSLSAGVKAGPFRAIGRNIGGSMLGGFAAVGVGAAIKGAIDNASDLNETVSKADNVFGSAAAQVEAWSKTAARSFGLSRQEALASASTFGDMFSQLGFGKAQAAKTSEQIVKLAADLGSFHNVDPSDVLDRIGGSLRGEYDSLQKLIPNINAARVEQEALAQTHKKSAKELTAAEKATATLAIITRDGANAANDFAETSGGAANQQRIAAARAKDLSAELGARLLPAYTKGLQLVNKLVEGLIAFSKWISDNQAKIKLVLEIILPLIAAYAAYHATVGVVTKVTKLWAAAQAILNGTLALNPIGLVVAALVGLGVALVLAWKHSETFRNIVKGAFDVVATAADWLFNHVIVPAVQIAIKHAQLLVDFYTIGAQAIVTVFRIAGDFIFTMIEKLLGAASHLPFVGGKFKGLQKDVEGWHSSFDSALTTASDKIGNFRGTVDDQLNAASAKFGGFRDGVNNSLNGIQKTVDVKVQAIATLNKLSDPRFAAADGGIMPGSLPDQATIAAGRGRGLVQWAEGETGGEAFIPLASSKRQRSLAIWERTGKLLGAFANGGLRLNMPVSTSTAGLDSGATSYAGSIAALVQQLAAKVLQRLGDPSGSLGGGAVGLIEAVMRGSGLPSLVTSSFRPGAGYHGTGNAVDFGWYGNNPAQLTQIARFWDRLGGSLLELIYSGDGGHFFKNGRRVGWGFYGAQTESEHYNHVHVAATAAAMERLLGGVQSRKASLFDSGGILGHGQLGLNLSGRDELVLNPDQTEAVRRGGLGRGAPLIGTVHVHDQVDLDLVLQRAEWRDRQGGF